MVDGKIKIWYPTVHTYKNIVQRTQSHFVNISNVWFGMAHLLVYIIERRSFPSRVWRHQSYWRHLMTVVIMPSLCRHNDSLDIFMPSLCRHNGSIKMPGDILWLFYDSLDIFMPSLCRHNNGIWWIQSNIIFSKFYLWYHNMYDKLRK